MSEDRSHKATRESLSALMDGENSELELRRTLKSFDSDDELRSSWQRYHLASSVMRRDFSGIAIDVSREVSAALAEETSPTQAHAVPSVVRNFGRTFGRVAIAASVAAVAVLGVQQMQTADISESGAQQVADTGALARAQTVEPVISEPRFQLPSGFEPPMVSARTVSTGSFNRVSETPEFNSRYQTLETELQVRAYMQRLMRQAEARAWASRVYAAPPVAESSQTVSSQDEQQSAK